HHLAQLPEYRQLELESLGEEFLLFLQKRGSAPETAERLRIALAKRLSVDSRHGGIHPWFHLMAAKPDEFYLFLKMVSDYIESGQLEALLFRVEHLLRADP